MFHTSLTLFTFALSLTSFLNAQDNLISPCPRFFSYEAGHKEPGKWYGILTMLSDFDTYGVFVQISLNKPALQLGNWYSAVFTENNREFVLVNAKDGLKANVPKKVKIFVKYDISKPPPVIEWIEVNARKLCPDTEITEISTKAQFNPRPSQVETTSNKPPGDLIGYQAPVSYKNDGFYMADLNLLATLLNAKEDLNLLKPLVKNETFGGPSSAETTSKKPAEGLVRPVPPSFKPEESYKDDLNLLTTLLTNKTSSPIETTSIKPGKDDLHLLSTLVKNEKNFGPVNSVELNFKPKPPQVKMNSNKPAGNSIGYQAPASYKNDGSYKADLNLLATLLNAKEDLNLLKPLVKNETLGGPSPVETTSNQPIGVLIGQDPAPTEDEEFYMGDFYKLFSTIRKDETEEEDICGTVVVPPAPLITYGQPTKEGEFPWHVAIYHSRGVDWTYICGASLVSKNFVITVAHCVTIPRSSKLLNPNNLSIYLGRHHLKRHTNSGIQGRQISEIIVHEKYNAQMYSDDIALLKLALPAEYTDYVRPICLWQESSDLNSILDKQGKIVGWGFDETGIVTDQLMQTEMPVVAQDTCLLSYPEFYFRYTSENTFCAGFRNGTTICNGDSGGGMVFPKSNSSPKNPVWQLRGLISISASASNKFKCDASHYVVFTDAAKYLDWIKNKIK